MTTAETTPAVPSSREHISSLVYDVARDRPFLFIVGQKPDTSGILPAIAHAGIESTRIAQLSLHEFPLPTSLINPYASVLLIDTSGNFIPVILRVATQRRKQRCSMFNKWYESYVDHGFDPEENTGNARMFARMLKEEQIYVLPVFGMSPLVLAEIMRETQQSTSDLSGEWGKIQSKLTQRSL